MNFPLSSMVLTSTEDNVYFITENNQLIRVNLALDLADEGSISANSVAKTKFVSDI